ncbi:MAG: LPS export ABC transporter periplasmic protein LptC [Cyclobacteriaceae bacterium]|nr:LPS export ABC transporter periplasmic protein LptC [Cyclobacteriaceae bacterium]
MVRAISIFIIILLVSCVKEAEEKEIPQTYTGPLSKLSGATIMYSDSAKQKAIVKAEELLDLQNGDREVPKGMFITFFEKDGTISATLKANYAYYYKEDDRWKATGNVVVNNIANKETLKSEELFWEPKNEDVYTEKFVRIETPGELMTGTGLKAKQDFSEWTLENPEGLIDVNDDGA